MALETTRVRIPADESSCRDVDWEKDATQSTSVTVGEADTSHGRDDDLIGRRILNFLIPQLTMQLSLHQS